MTIYLPRNPYPAAEALNFWWKLLTGRPGRQVAASLSARLTSGPEASAPLRWVGFVGDVMPLFEREGLIDPRLVEWLADCELLVGNFEGIVTSEKFWLPFLMRHRPEVFRWLEALAPAQRWVLSVANNHALDYGPQGLAQTLAAIDAAGMRWFGTTERPRLTLLDQVTITGFTWWSNGRSSGVCRADPGPPADPGLHLAFPHWGYEFEPTVREAVRARVPDGYSVVIGHHSHHPQPLERLSDGRLVMWSLGNFCTHVAMPVMSGGAVVKLGLAYDQPTPRIAEVLVAPIEIDNSQRGRCAIRLLPSPDLQSTQGTSRQVRAQ